MSITVLFLAANPRDTAPLRLDEEVRHVTRSIRAAGFRDDIRLVPWFAARPDDLVQGLLEHRPQVLHVSGHGDRTGEISFVGDDGRTRPVSPEALRRILGVLRDVRVVLLNACHSAAQAAAIKEHVDVTIGMSRAIGDRAAIAFAGAFYRALGFGLSVQEAFELGVATLLLEGIPGENIPQLVTRDGAAASLHLLRTDASGSDAAAPEASGSDAAGSDAAGADAAPDAEPHAAGSDAAGQRDDRPAATSPGWVQNITSSAPGAIAQGAIFGNVVNHPSLDHPASPADTP
ncbi:CHAT domain-containing protein [Nucisporomicrobium flavum]|uniref:CHAT domain-containing protein n=1 Tax=Nucisporomicrobium flavum TaxID=2785915 RepID=UPI0018F754E1|nr:CHAT domain-containing protein [Nucisporomicrobium flavum]